MPSAFPTSQLNQMGLQGTILIGSNTASSSTARSISPLTYTTSNLNGNVSSSKSDGVTSSTDVSKDPTSLFELDSPKRCWICFGDESDSEGRWVKPCYCSLVSHEECLLAWISENQRGQSRKKVQCPQCNEVYQLSEPPSFFIDLFGFVDGLFQSAVPYLTLVGLAGTVLVTSTTYGAYVVLTMCGAEDGEKLLGSPHPWGWRVWVGLPLIPFVLVGSRTKYLDSFLPLLPFLIMDNEQIMLDSLTSPKMIIYLLPWARLFYNSTWKYLFNKVERKWLDQSRGLFSSISNDQTLEPNVNNENVPLETEWGTGIQNNDDQEGNLNDPAAYVLNERKDLARTVVGALLLPGISSVTGNFLCQIPFLRNRLGDTFFRSIVGGCLFVLLKDITSLLYKYYLVRRLRRRQIKSVDSRR